MLAERTHIIEERLRQRQPGSFWRRRYIEVFANHLLRTLEQAKTAPETPDTPFAPDSGVRPEGAQPVYQPNLGWFRGSRTIRPNEPLRQQSWVRRARKRGENGGMAVTAGWCWSRVRQRLSSPSARHPPVTTPFPSPVLPRSPPPLSHSENALRPILQAAQAASQVPSESFTNVRRRPPPIVTSSRLLVPASCSQFDARSVCGNGFLPAGLCPLRTATSAASSGPQRRAVRWERFSVVVVISCVRRAQPSHLSR